MIEKYSIRTDLALEQKERFENDHVEIQGVVLEEEYDKVIGLNSYDRLVKDGYIQTDNTIVNFFKGEKS